MPRSGATCRTSAAWCGCSPSWRRQRWSCWSSTWRWLRSERARRGRLLLRAAAGVGAGALVLAAFFAISFDAAFAAFHALFFKSGTWQFGPDSNLIRLFPEPFWFEVSLLAGASIVLSALLAAWLARRDLGSAPAGR